jgi:hypothetical protein
LSQFATDRSSPRFYLIPITMIAFAGVRAAHGDAFAPVQLASVELAGEDLVFASVDLAGKLVALPGVVRYGPRWIADDRAAAEQPGWTPSQFVPVRFDERRRGLQPVTEIDGAADDERLVRPEVIDFVWTLYVDLESVVDESASDPRGDFGSGTVLTCCCYQDGHLADTSEERAIDRDWACSIGFR